MAHPDRKAYAALGPSAGLAGTVPQPIKQITDRDRHHQQNQDERAIRHPTINSTKKASPEKYSQNKHGLGPAKKGISPPHCPLKETQSG